TPSSWTPTSGTTGVPHLPVTRPTPYGWQLTGKGADVLSLKGVVAGYGGAHVLQDIDLACVDGTVTCIVGPNGAGKSTVLRVISGLLRSSAGEITMNGERLD